MYTVFDIFPSWRRWYNAFSINARPPKPETVKVSIKPRRTIIKNWLFPAHSPSIIKSSLIFSKEILCSLLRWSEKIIYLIFVICDFISYSSTISHRIVKFSSVSIKRIEFKISSVNNATISSEKRIIPAILNVAKSSIAPCLVSLLKNVIKGSPRKVLLSFLSDWVRSSQKFLIAFW